MINKKYTAQAEQIKTLRILFTIRRVHSALLNLISRSMAGADGITSRLRSLKRLNYGIIT